MGEVEPLPYKTKVRLAFTFASGRRTNRDLTVGDRGIAALCEPLHWGPTAKAD